MKQIALSLVVLLAAAAGLTAAPRRVALIIQDHSTGKAKPPMTALADTLGACLTGQDLHVLLPDNSLGVKQNESIYVFANGKDENEAVEALAELAEKTFGE